MLFPSRRSILSSLVATSLTSPSLLQPPEVAILGGFLQPELAYSDYVLSLNGGGVDACTVYTYNDRRLLEDDTSVLIGPNTMLVVGHSKGAKTIATWMANPDHIIVRNRIPCVLIEPVDVNPPSSKDTSSVLDMWTEHQDCLAKIPTLIISAPYTQTSKRYGKATNLCAPIEKDARAFFRRSPTAEGIEFPNLGHNDVTSSSLGGCANGPDGGAQGSKAVASLVNAWIRNKTNLTEALIHEECAISYTVWSH